MDKVKIIEKADRALDTIRPYLQTDGGNVSVVELTDDMTLKVRLEGACNGCPMSLQTFERGIETVIRREVAEIREVVAV